jgi:hypothetical protein
MTLAKIVMKEKTKSDGDILREYLSQFKDRSSYKEETKRIMGHCKVEYYIVNNWKYNISKIPPLAKEKIEEIIGKKIFDINK